MKAKTLLRLSVLTCVAVLAAPTVPGQSSPAPLVNFRSMLQTESASESPDGSGVWWNVVPPDTTGAVGDYHIVTAANFTLRICNKLGGNVRTFDLSGWWNSLRTGATTPAVYAFDPVVTFDPYFHRWIVGSSCFATGSTPSRFVLAVSRTSDPSGQWYYYEFSCADAAWRYPTGAWFDQPTIGFNRNFIGISITTFGAEHMPPPAGHDSVIILDRAQAYSGSARYWLLTGQPPRPGTADTSYPWNFRTAVCRTYDPMENKLYLLRHHSSSSATYALSSIEPGPSLGTLTVRANYVYPQASGWGHSMSGGADCGNIMPQAGITNRVNPCDERINTAVYRNGSIWAAHGAFMGSYPSTAHSEVQWFEVRPGGTFRQIGRVGAAGTWLIVPAIGVNTNGDAIVGYSRCSASTYVSSGYAYRTGSDPLNTLRSAAIYRPGNGPFQQYDGMCGMPGRNRTGDYSAAAVDPADNLTLWVAQEFAETGNRWGIQWAAVQPPGVGAPAFASSTLHWRGVVGAPFTNHLTAAPLATNFSVAGTLPPGLALDALSGRISGIPTSAGEFTVAVAAQNAAGSSTATLDLNISESDLSDAIDVLRTVSTLPANAWFRQTNITHDGVDAARSGYNPNSSATWMETQIIAPAEVSFWWKVSSERADRLSLYLDGVLQTNISGEVSWTQVGLNVPGTNTHRLRWEYRKDTAWTAGQDAGWVDELSIRDRTPVIPRYLYQMRFVLKRPILAIPFPDPDPGPVYELLDKLPPGMTFDAKTGAFGGSVQTPGTYSFTVRKTTAFGTQVVPVAFTISGIFLDGALNEPGMAYASGGDAEWTTSDEKGASHDGFAAARSGAVAPGQESWLEREVKGPALLSFWWALSGDLDDQFSVLVDGQPRALLAGKAAWSQKLLAIPAGAHTVRWRFQKGEASNLGEPEEAEGPDANPVADAGSGLAWLDEVAVLPAAAPVLPQLTQFRFAAGLEVSRQIVAGNDPDSYALAGQLPPGLVFDTASGVLSGTPEKPGIFQLQVSASNPAGTGGGTLIIFVDDRGLGAALGLQDLVPDTSPNSPWFVDAANLYLDNPAARSGKVDDGGVSWMELPVEGPADASFVWSVSSQDKSDYLRLLVDGTEADRISGEVGWQVKHVLLPPGSHTLRWQYEKDQAGAAGQDAGWVAAFSSQGVPLPDFVGPRLWHGQTGKPFSVTIQAEGADLILADSLPAPFTFNPQTRLLSGTPPSEGAFSFNLQAINVAGTNNRVAVLLVDSLPIAQGVDYAGPWQNDAAHPWFVQSEKMHDNLSAAQSGLIGDNASTSLKCSFDGPGTLACWMAVSSQRNADYFRVLLDGEVYAQLAGDRPWSQVTLPIPAGTHQVEWRYEKDASGAEERDCAWLDQVTFTPAPALPVVTLPAAATGIVATAFALAPGVDGLVDTWDGDGLPLGVGIDQTTGRLYGTPAIAGQFLATIKATNPRGTGSAQILITVLTPFESWIAGRGLTGSLAAPNADPDQDGIPNLIEYALGLMPDKPEAVGQALQTQVSKDTVELGFTRDTAALGCTLLVETSTDLASWNVVAKGGDGLAMAPLSAEVSVAEEPQAGSLNRVTVAVLQQSRPALFLRLRVGYSP